MKLEHIAPYLPYEVKIWVDKDHAGGEQNDLFILSSLTDKTIGYITTNKGIKIGNITLMKSVKLILHPLSDLTKPCLPDGKIPIVELAKIAFPSFPINEIIQLIKENSVFAGLWVNIGHDYLFRYSEREESFDCVKIYVGKVDHNCHIPNQLQLFQKLFSWHFDVFGLIESGEAIDINTFES